MGVSTQPADGYNLVVLQEGAIVLNPHLYAGRLSYDPDKDLVPISAITMTISIKVKPVMRMRCAGAARNAVFAKV